MKKLSILLTFFVTLIVIVLLFYISHFRKEKPKMNEYLITSANYICQDIYVVQNMVRESNGKMWHLAYSDDFGFYLGGACMAYSTNEGQTWILDESFPSAKDIPDAQPGYLSHSAVTIDQNDVLHLIETIYMISDDSEIYYTKREDGSWSTPIKISTDSGYDLSWNGVSICVESDGDVHAVWDMEDYPSHDMHIMYNHMEDGVWQGEEKLVEDGEEVIMRCDSDDNVHMIYTMGEIYYKKKTSGVWGDPVQITSLTGQLEARDIFVDDAGIIHLLYEKFADKTYYAYFDGTWHVNEAIADGAVIAFTGLLGNANDMVVVYQSGLDVVYRKRLGVDSWSDEIVLEANTNARAVAGGIFSYVPVVAGVHTNLPATGICYTKYVQATTPDTIYFMTTSDFFMSSERPIVFYDTTRTQEGEEQPITFSDRADTNPELPIVFYER